MTKKDVINAIKEYGKLQQKIDATDSKHESNKLKALQEELLDQYDDFICGYFEVTEVRRVTTELYIPDLITDYDSNVFDDVAINTYLDESLRPEDSEDINIISSQVKLLEEII